MLASVRKSLRITNTAFDDEIEELIDAGKQDLKLAGIYIDESKDDPLIKRAIITYCKAHFGYDNPDADRFNDSYLMLKQHLSLAGDYREPLG
ncbi:head-tail connector protein [Pseudobacillus badius]|uniref:head-tail connector protein n=1 Tax=Bacillus badius TaxID=1455 RepID=UPI0024A448B2|nr:head-tail connector protein [Bacillus badius]GLY09595.1 hypothetical protein Bbad01_08110 [Bacillus badius]